MGDRMSQLSLKRLRPFVPIVFVLWHVAPSSVQWNSQFPSGPPPVHAASAPDLVVSSITNPPSTAVVGGSFPVTDTTGNSGSSTAGASTTRYRLSTDAAITSSDPLLTGSRTVPSLAKGTSSNGTVSVSIPTTLTPGTYFLGACADDLTVVAESNETNNCRVSSTTVSIFAAPTISSITPNSGSIGTVVTISGANFGTTQGSSTVTFNGITATPSSWSNTSIMAPVPTGASSGPLVVTVAGAPSNGVQFTVAGITYIYDQLGRLRAVSDPASDTAIYNYDSVGNLVTISRQSSSLLSVIEFSPKSGTSGTIVNIYGTGFSATATQNTVTFNGTSATVVSATPNYIQTSVPVGTTSGLIAVTTPSGSATSNEPFVVSSTVPQVSGFTPSIGLAGAALTITGSNFDPAYGNNRVKFNDRALAWILSGTTTSLATTVPVGATSGRLSVIAPSGTATSNGDFFIPPSPNQTSQVENTARTSIGQNIQVAVNNTEKISLVLFDGNAGQQIRLVVSNVTVSPQIVVRIYNPDGTLLASSVVGSSGATLGPYTLTMSGSHQILVGTRIISTIAGNGVPGSGGDGGAATSASISRAYGIAIDSQGNLYIADTDNHKIRKVSTSGTITTVAGTGSAGYSGDGNKAVKAQLNEPYDVALDSQGNLFVADRSNHRIRKITTSGSITTFAGNGIAGFSGDGGPAISAQLRFPEAVTLDSSGNLYIGDGVNNRLRKVATNGIITTVAGTGSWPYNGDGIPATSANLNNISSIRVDLQGNFFLGEGQNTSRVRKIDTSGIISTFAGTGITFFNGDNIPASQANISYPYGLAMDGQSSLYIADAVDNRIRRVDSTGIITTAAGTGATPGSYNGDSIPGHMANLKEPWNVLVTTQGDLVIADTGNYRIRKITKALPGNVTLSVTSP
jgi:sugar lactone lactonase YvrE